MWNKTQGNTTPVHKLRNTMGSGITQLTLMLCPVFILCSQFSVLNFLEGISWGCNLSCLFGTLCLVTLCYAPFTADFSAFCDCSKKLESTVFHSLHTDMTPCYVWLNVNPRLLYSDGAPGAPKRWAYWLGSWCRRVILWGSSQVGLLNTWRRARVS